MPHARTIARRLWRARGRTVSHRCLLDAMYADHPDGGPDDAEGVLTLTIFHLRRRFGKDAIRTAWGEGYSWNPEIQLPIDWQTENE